MSPFEVEPLQPSDSEIDSEDDEAHRPTTPTPQTGVKSLLDERDGGDHMATEIAALSEIFGFIEAKAKNLNDFFNSKNSKVKKDITASLKIELRKKDAIIKQQQQRIVDLEALLESRMAPSDRAIVSGPPPPPKPSSQQMQPWGLKTGRGGGVQRSSRSKSTARRSYAAAAANPAAGDVGAGKGKAPENARAASKPPRQRQQQLQQQQPKRLNFEQKIRARKLNHLANVQTASNADFIANLKLIQEHRANVQTTPAPRASVVYKNIFIENPLGNSTDLVTDPFVKIRSILFDVYKVPRSICEISFVGVKKSVLELFIRDSDLEEAIATLSNPGSDLLAIFITTNILDTPKHRIFKKLSTSCMEQATILRCGIMLKRAMRQGVQVMQEIARSNVDEFTAYQIEACARHIYFENNLNFQFPNSVTRTNFEEKKSQAQERLPETPERIKFPLTVPSSRVGSSLLSQSELLAQAKNFAYASLNAQLHRKIWNLSAESGESQ
ncbi:hypothetical protein HDU80_003247 [Chytriomyces hyalinus]|nr:hypothetical protein HDU80_003247 [Chytriomyces hyalinus]